MRSIGYHFYENGKGIYKSSRCSTDEAIVINCAGRFISDSDVKTLSSGRLDYYFMYLIEGELEVNFPDYSKCFANGSFIIFPPDTPYSYKKVNDGRLDYFWVHFTGRDCKKLLEHYGLCCFPEENKIFEASGITPRIQQFMNACASEDHYKDAELAILFTRLLLNVARSVKSRDDNPLKKSISHINSSYNTDIKIPDLAKIENLSVSRYNFLFKKIMGISPKEYIIKTRMSFACELLNSTDLSIKEISMLVGYDDSHFFSRIFKSSLGKSPMQYRNCT